VADAQQAADTPSVLSASERGMLKFALDTAQEKIWSEGGFTEEDQAALDSLRRLQGDAPEVGGGESPTGHSVACLAVAGGESDRDCPECSW
jgi:hypothetical protein